MISEARLEELIQLLPNFDPYLLADRHGCWFDHAAARKPIEFIEQCVRHVEGEFKGKPFLLEDWQKAIVANLFGWKNPDGTRRFREILIYVPRKNGKSTLVAAIALYLLLCDAEPAAKVFGTAAETDQAAVTLELAKEMVLSHPALANRCKIYKGSIYYPAGKGRYKLLTSKAKTKHGFNVHAGVIDELHAIGDPELIDVLKTGTPARRQPIIIYTTTADFAGESVCNETYEYAKQILAGADDPTFLPVVYEAERSDDWESEDTWRKANPNFGVSVKPEYLRNFARTARLVPSKRNTFLRLHLNVQTASQEVWIKPEDWAACRGKRSRSQLRLWLKREPAFGGLDLSSGMDLTAFGLWFPAQKVSLTWFWCPHQRAMERQKAERALYLTWADQGYIKLIPGNVMDYDVVEADVLDICEKYDVREIGYDPYNATHLVTRLQATKLELTSVRQGFLSLSPPAKEFERMVVGGELSHGNDPVMNWNVSNAEKVEDTTGNIKPVKKSKSARIDGVAACLTAMSRAIARPVKERSVYERRGIKRVWKNR